MKINRYSASPILPNVPGTWMHDQTANPDILRFGDSWHLYFRGQQGGHDRIGVARIPCDRFDGYTWDVWESPVIDVGAPGEWDETHVLDPATVLVDGTIFLYYSAVSTTCSRSICLATSTDGITFTKFDGNPVAIGGGPEVVYRDGTFHLFYWGPSTSSDGFELYRATSEDGYHFAPADERPVLETGPEGSWDSMTVETPRIFLDRGVYYMLYCGSDRYKDYPFHAGLATSRDLVEWTKYAGNPVFSRGEEHAWDEGAIWFTTVERIDGTYYLWYEGYGGGSARTEEYGTYLKGGRSQTGLATLEAPYFIVSPEDAP